MLGYTAHAWPAYGWVAAALALVTLMTILGLGFLTPRQRDGLPRIAKARPDMKWISDLDAALFLCGRGAGLMQVAIIVVMTRFRTGI